MPEQFEIGWPTPVDPGEKRPRAAMTLDVYWIGSGTKALDERHLAEICDMCGQAFEHGDVAVRLSDGVGIEAFWHRRCLETQLHERCQLDVAILDARYDAVAEGWASRARA